MSNVVQFASKKDIARSRNRTAAAAVLAPQIYAAAITGEPMTAPRGYTYTLATAGDFQILAGHIRPGLLNVVVHWEGARTAKNRYGRVFSGDFDHAGQLVGKPFRWERGEWESLIFERFRLTRTA